MTRKQILRIVLSFAGLLIAITAPKARAQFEDGSLIGTIRDGSGAVVSNAAVTVTNVNTGATKRAVSNASGDYEVPSLHVGTYSIQAEASGFAPAQAKNISIAVGARQRIDLTLSVGQTATTVEVSDVALQIETATSERGQSISGYQTEALPLVSRNFSDLLGLVTGSRQAPTAATTSSISSLVRAGAYNVNGQRSMFNNFLLDGMDNNAYGESNQGFDNQIIAIAPDSVADFKVVTNNESAEYGRSSGATVNVASRSGTNSFHGTLYEFFRNTDLNAAGFFKPTLVGKHRNQCSLSKAHVQSQPVRHELRRPDRQEQALLLPGLRRFPPDAQAPVCAIRCRRRTRLTESWWCRSRIRSRGSPIRQEPRFPRAPSILFRLRSSATSSSL